MLFRKAAAANGVSIVHDRVTAIGVRGRIETVALASGKTIACHNLVNAAGAWAGALSALAGVKLPVEPRKRLVSTFWSALAGLPDTPENYKTVRYELAPQGDRTKLTITQDNNATQEEASEAEKNWRMVLDGIKKLVEG